MNLLGHHPKKTFSHKYGMSLSGKGILILQSPVNETICGEISSQLHDMDVADAADMEFLHHCQIDHSVYLQYPSSVFHHVLPVQGPSLHLSAQI
jgi:hypothetical protein